MATQKTNDFDNENIIPPYFYFYSKYCDYFSLISNEEAGKVIKYICRYVTSPPDFDETNEVDKAAEGVNRAAVIMLIMNMKNDINNAFKKYKAQCENGKKGGAPKGNKNASKKKSETKEHTPLDEIDYEIAIKITDVIYYEAKSTNFEIDKYLSKSQIATIAACYYLSEINYFDDIDCIFNSLKDAVINESAYKICKNIKDMAKRNCDDLQKFGFNSFEEAFSECKQRADRLVKIPLEQLNILLTEAARLYEED